MSQQEGSFSKPINQSTATGEELEEGEVIEDRDMSYDEDYSPGSLVIDDVERGTWGEFKVGSLPYTRGGRFYFLFSYTFLLPGHVAFWGGGGWG